MNVYILWGSRIVGRNLLLQEVHESHPGISGIRVLPDVMYGGQGLIVNWKKR